MLSRMQNNLLPYRAIVPKIDKTAFIAPNAYVIGDVEIGPESSIWYGCTVRGDVNDIKIGARTNIQDGSVIHVTRKVSGTYIGDDVTVGHMAMLHACRVGDRAFIGMQACILDEAVIEPGAMVAAGALVTPGKIVPSGQLWGGRPARYMRDMTEEEIAFLAVSADNYVRLAREYMED